MITDIRIKAMVDCMKDGRGIIEEGREYVDTEPGKYLHVVVAARFQPDFSGVLRLETLMPKAVSEHTRLSLLRPNTCCRTKSLTANYALGLPAYQSLQCSAATTDQSWASATQSP